MLGCLHLQRHHPQSLRALRILAIASKPSISIQKDLADGPRPEGIRHTRLTARICPVQASLKQYLVLNLDLEYAAQFRIVQNRSTSHEPLSDTDLSSAIPIIGDRGARKNLRRSLKILLRISLHPIVRSTCPSEETASGG